MHSLTSWVQTSTRQPNNPFQQTREVAVGAGGDGGYASFYWNQVPNPPDSGLVGALRGAPLPGWARWFLTIGGAVALGGAAYGATRLIQKSRTPKALAGFTRDFPDQPRSQLPPKRSRPGYPPRRPAPEPREEDDWSPLPSDQRRRGEE